jgi:hypothetical protein
MDQRKSSQTSRTTPATLSSHQGFTLWKHGAHQNLTGARGLLAVSYLMTKRGLLPVVIFVALGFSLTARQASGSPSGRGGAFTLAQLRGLTAGNNGSVLFQPTLFNSLDNPVFGLPFSNREVFSLATTFNLVGATPQSFLPFSAAIESPKASRPATSVKDSSDRLFDLRPNFDYVTGEVGFLYGHSSGKFGGDYLQGYIFGEVGNDRIHISAGASYEEWNGRVPRWGR